MGGQHRVVQYMAAWLQQHVPTVNDSGKGDWGDSSRTGMPRRHTEGHTLLVSRHQNGGRTVKSGLQKVQGRTGGGGAAVGTGGGPAGNDGMGSARPVIEDKLGTRILHELARRGLDLPGYSQ
jgi:hypothetical protein